MAELRKVNQVYELLRQGVRQRPDIGVGKGLLDCVLEPSSPFDSKSMRSPKRWFVLSVFVAASAFSGFVYFNNLW